MTTKNGCVAAAALLVGLGGPIVATAPLRPQGPEYACFPTCVVDGRFLVVTGDDPTTLAASQVLVGLTFPVVGGSGEVNFDLFDGDRDAINWDVKNVATNTGPPQLEIELYADPDGTGAGERLLKAWAAGEIPFVNSDWTEVRWPHDSGALTAPGPDQQYRYTLKISPADAAVDLGWNAFKVRTHGALDLLPQAVAFIGSMVVLGDVPAMYPNYPDLAGSPYDGTWTFRFRLPAGLNNVTIFDGDMDYGDADCSINDTDDRDSTGIPAFGAGAVEEGVASTGVACTGGVGVQTGLPAEDSAGAAFRRVPLLQGDPPLRGIVYRVVAPDGQTFLNRNPSGNREWEQFRIQKVARTGIDACPPAGFADHDCETTRMPEGVWELRVDGMDLSNLNFLFFNFRVAR